MRQVFLALSIIIVICGAAFAQAPPAIQDPAATAPADPFLAQLIPRNSKLFIAEFIAEGDKATGFETYFAAAIRKKKVPLIMVTDRDQADFVITGSADKKGAGWAKKVFLADWRSTTSASFQVVNVRTGVVAFADSSHKYSANRGLRSSAEKLAKYLKRKIEDDEKEARKRR